MNATAADTHISPTPILDHLVPLPPQIAPGSGMVILIAVWLGVLITLAVSVVLGRPPILRQWILVDLPHWFIGHWTESGIIFIAVSALGVCFAMVAVHEIGHVLGGLCAGFRFKQWLAEIPETTSAFWLRTRAEAAIPEARGDLDGALRKLDEYENAILALPNATRREILLRMLRRWKSELRSG